MEPERADTSVREGGPPGADARGEQSIREVADLADQAIQKALRVTTSASAKAPLPEDAEVYAQSARDDLLEFLDVGVRAGDRSLLQQAHACARAACEHLAFGELLEARTLLTAASRQLALVRSVPPQGA
ncbi:hypothetical protein F4560_001877 [Saccharothrix ecbatanensis]|uniref:Uncharacterized protein n=1 Tax=Saccharothrix ecbatanensis TaxID=1105145 RepID=A0A7W9LZN8_9PSEU|nr:hypothetical protein [Saccharothrix ecbatanensis]MBB5802109.1 hypothetical protein [Saccharothrix ecbatanensis]